MTDAPPDVLQDAPPDVLPDAPETSRPSTGGTVDGRPALDLRDDAPPPALTMAVADSMIAAMREVRTPLEAELALCHTFGPIELGVVGDAAERLSALVLLLTGVIAHAEQVGDADALALLRACAAIGPAPTRALADQAAARLAGNGVRDRSWASLIGRPTPLRAWRYGDVFGEQVSVGVQFVYQGREHAVMVLIDRPLGGGVKDAWVADGKGARTLRETIATQLSGEPDVVFDDIDEATAAGLLAGALSRLPCPEQEDQFEDVARHLYLVQSRTELLCELIGLPRPQYPDPAELDLAGGLGFGVDVDLGSDDQADDDQADDDQADDEAADDLIDELVAEFLDDRGAGLEWDGPAGQGQDDGPTGGGRPGATTGAVLRLKVSLAGIRPPVWRRLEVPAGITLARLHRILQTTFDWSDSHLHCFETRDGHRGRGRTLQGAVLRRTRLDSVLAAPGQRLRYVYDFGDDWVHEITVEERLPADPGVDYPRCTGGRRRTPPEDCGGPIGYAVLLEALADPAHPEHEELSEWAPGDFDPASFDRAAVDAALRGR